LGLFLDLFCFIDDDRGRFFLLELEEKALFECAFSKFYSMIKDVLTDFLNYSVYIYVQKKGLKKVIVLREGKYRYVQNNN
jgi:hypothetical protein